MKKISEPSFSEELKETKLNEIKDLRTDGCAFAKEACSQDFSGYQFFECTFRNITFTGNLSGTLFADCIFDHCDLSNCRMEEAVLRRVILRSCRLTGTQLIRASFQDISIETCRADYANFSGTKWLRASLRESDFTEASFSMSSFKETKLKECAFVNAEFLDTLLSGLDFSDSDISGFTVNPENLRGSVMNQIQAAACAQLLGITVR